MFKLSLGLKVILTYKIDKLVKFSKKEREESGGIRSPSILYEMLFKI